MIECESKILAMQRLQDAARFDYHLYFQGEFGLEKLPAIAKKFSREYDTELTKSQRSCSGLHLKPLRTAFNAI
jgi:hypothetical protein